MPLPKKEIPPPTMGNFVPPDRKRKYFEFADRVPFVADAQDFDLANALWLAEASFAAYGDAQAPVDLSLLPTGVNSSYQATGDVQFLRLESPEAIILAFRGTRIEGFQDPIAHLKGFALNWKDLVTDMQFLQDDVDQQHPEQGRIHCGFKKAMDGCFPQVLAASKPKAGQPDKKLWLTGHSLGAALATVAAARLNTAGIKTQGIYTYGSPRVGDKTFIDHFKAAFNTWRFVDHRDVVTTVPPEGHYGHVGHLCYLTKDGQLLTQPRKEDLLEYIHESFSFVRQIVDVVTKDFNPGKVETFPIPFEALADHAPLYYADKIWNLQP